MSKYIDKTVNKFISEDAGSGLFAEDDFEPGHHIALVTDPFVMIPNNDIISRGCYECLFQKTSVSKCSGCGTVKYCSKACQAKSWKRIHKLECKIFRKVRTEGHETLPTPVRGVIQVLLRRSAGFDTDSRWSQLMSHKEKFKRKDQRWADITLQARAAIAYTGLETNVMDVATSILCCFGVNAFNATAGGSPSGLCFEPLLAKANHSCVPNAFVSFHGRQVSLKALVTIRKGEEIRIAYVDTNQKRAMRILQLEENYLFTCKCPKCTDNWSVYTTFLNNPCRTANKLSIVTNYEVLENTAHTLAQVSVPDIGPVDSLINSLIEHAAQLQNPQEQFGTLKSALYKLPVLSQGSSLATAPYPFLLSGFVETYIEAAEFEAAFILLLNSAFSIQPFQFPEPWHITRILTLKMLTMLMSNLPHSLGVFLPTLEAIPNAESLELLPCVYSISLLIALYLPLGYGDDSQIMEDVCQELKDLEHHIKESHHVDCLIMMRHGVKEGKGRETAVRYWRKLEALADISLMYRVISTVDCTGRGRREM